MFDFIAFDTETTGTSHYNDSIIEVAGVKFQGGKVVATFQSFANPERSIPVAAQRVHGITDEMVKDAPHIEDVLIKFSDFCEHAHLVAHNAPFDVRFIGEAATKYNVPLPAGRIFDTYQMGKILLPELMNHRLENIAKNLKVATGEFHRAVDDSKYCGQVFLQLLLILQKKKGSCTIKDLVELHQKELLFPVIEAQPKQLGLF